MNKIEVFVDIYKHPFPGETHHHCYANIRAINPNEQAIVEECLIATGDSPLLASNLPIINNGSFSELLEEKNRQCVLDIAKQKFEF